MNDTIKYWIETSLYDLEVANSLFGKKHFLHSAFLCHQSVEKMLKALFVKKHGSFPPKIHNLVKLAELSGIRSEMTEEQMTFLAELDPMNIEARYPTYKDNVRNLLNKQDAKNILTKSTKLLKWLQSRIN